ncbi:hypothetical protein ACLOJK_003704 [Asimina triloba]
MLKVHIQAVRTQAKNPFSQRITEDERHQTPHTDTEPTPPPPFSSSIPFFLPLRFPQRTNGFSANEKYPALYPSSCLSDSLNPPTDSKFSAQQLYTLSPSPIPSAHRQIASTRNTYQTRKKAKGNPERSGAQPARNELEREKRKRQTLEPSALDESLELRPSNEDADATTQKRDVEGRGAVQGGVVWEKRGEEEEKEREKEEGREGRGG